MSSPVSRIRRRWARQAWLGPAALACALAASLGASARAQAAVAASPAPLQTAPAALERGSRPFADRFPNVVLKTHEGRTVRFYDDLLKDKIVLINFMYATCTER